MRLIAATCCLYVAMCCVAPPANAFMMLGGAPVDECAERVQEKSDELARALTTRPLFLLVGFAVGCACGAVSRRMR